MARKNLTPKVRELVARDRHSRPPVGRLTDAEIELLRTVARRQGDFGEAVSAPRAITALASANRPAVALQVLTSVLSDGEAARTDRITAARGLGQLATPESEATLLGHVRDRDPRVQQDVFAALGTFGGRAAAAALDGLPEPDDRAARRQLVFTRALIAHRYDLDGPFLPDVAGAGRRPGPPEQIATVRMGTRTAAATAEDLERLYGSTYGIECNERGFSLECGPTDWTLFVNEGLGPSITSLTNLFDRPWIAGILAERRPRQNMLVARYVLLSRPAERTGRLDVVRADGTTVYTGTAERSDASIAFTVADVDRPGTAPTHIEGRITPGGVMLDVVIASAGRTGVRVSTRSAKQPGLGTA